MTFSTQIYRHGVFQIHDRTASLTGTMFPGTIVPIRQRWPSILSFQNEFVESSSMMWPFPADDPIPPPALTQVYENLFRILSDEAKQIEEYPEPLKTLMTNGSDGDRTIGGHGPFGTNVTNPIPVNGPIGQILYLSSLRLNDERILFHRLGSIGKIDVFECVDVKCTDWKLLYLDMYHPRKSKIAPEGYSIAGENVLLSGVTHLVTDFPRRLYYGIVEYSEKRFGISIADPSIRLRVEAIDFVRPPQHLAIVEENRLRWVSGPKDVVRELISETLDAQHSIYETLTKFRELEVDGKNGLPIDGIAVPEVAFFPIGMAIHSLFKWRQDEPYELADKLCENVLRENIDDGSFEMTVPEAMYAFQAGFPKYQKILFAIDATPSAVAMELSGLFSTKQNYLVGTALVAIIAIILKAMKRIVEERAG